MALIRFPSHIRDRIPWMTLSIGLICLMFSLFYLDNQANLNKALSLYCVTQLSKPVIQDRSNGSLSPSRLHQIVDSCKNLLRRIHSAEDKKAEINSLIAMQKHRPGVNEHQPEKWRKKFENTYERFILLAPVKDYTNTLSYQAGSYNVFSMLSASLVHVDIPHLLMNLFFFLLFTSIVEVVLGRSNVVLLYLLFALGSHSIFSLYYASTPGAVYTIGLSGVVMGMMVLSLILAASIQLSQLNWRFVAALFGFLVLFVLADYLQTLYMTSSQPINYVAHASGAILGLLAGLYFHRRYFAGKSVQVLVLTSDQVEEVLQESPTASGVYQVIQKCGLRWREKRRHLSAAIRSQFHLYRKKKQKHKPIPPDKTPYGAIMQFGDEKLKGKKLVVMASPVYVESGIDQLHVLPQHKLIIQQEQALQLITELNNHFAQDGIQFHFVTPHQWLLSVEQGSAIGTRIQTQPLHLVENRTIDYSHIQGDDKTDWLKLINEIQMFLHVSVVNQERTTQSKLPINSLWLWGTGALPQAIRTGWTQVYSDDALARGLATLSQSGVAETDRLFDDLSKPMLKGQILVVLNDDTLRKIDKRIAVSVNDTERARLRKQYLVEKIFKPIVYSARHRQTAFCRVTFNSGYSINFDKRVLSRWSCQSKVLTQPIGQEAHGS